MDHKLELGDSAAANEEVVEGIKVGSIKVKLFLKSLLLDKIVSIDFSALLKIVSNNEMKEVVVKNSSFCFLYG